MSKKTWVSVMIFLSVFAMFPGQISTGKDGKDLPQMNHGKPWRIAYCESGEFVNYASTLYALANGLSELGWFNAQGLLYSPGQKESRMMWNWLGKNSEGSSRFWASSPLGAYGTGSLSTSN